VGEFINHIFILYTLCRILQMQIENLLIYESFPIYICNVDAELHRELINIRCIRLDCVYLNVQDINLTWNTEHPDFTLCFQHSVLIYIQCGLLWLVAPFYVIHLSRLRDVQLPKTRLFLLKMVGINLLWN